MCDLLTHPVESTVFATSPWHLHLIEIYPSDISHVGCIISLQILHSKTFKYFTPSFITEYWCTHHHSINTFSDQQSLNEGKNCPYMNTLNLPNFKVSDRKHISSPYQNSEGMKTYPCCCLGYCKNRKFHFNTDYFTLNPVALNYNTFPQFQYWTKCSVEWFHLLLLFSTKFWVIFILKETIKKSLFFW